FHFRPERDWRRRYWRNFQEHRRRCELEKTRRWSSRANWPGWVCSQRPRSKNRHGGCCKVWKGGLGGRTTWRPEEAEFFVPKMAAKNGSARARSIRVRFISARSVSTLRITSACICSGSRCLSRTTVEKTFARI